MQINRGIKSRALFSVAVLTLSFAVGLVEADSSKGVSELAYGSGNFVTVENPSGSVVSATVTRVGSGFQISWVITGDVSTIRISEGTTVHTISSVVLPCV